MRYVVNVCVALRRDDSWLLIVRGDEGHAAGELSLVGGKCEGTEPATDVLEATARREVAEEIGVDLTDVPLTYVENGYFTTDQGDPVINVVFAAELPAGALPTVASPAEVAAIQWRTLADLKADPSCPPWTLRPIRRATA